MAAKGQQEGDSVWFWFQDIWHWVARNALEPKTYGADSLVEVAYWVGGAILAVIAVLSLRQRVRQAKGTFLLELDDRWDNLLTARKAVAEFLQKTRNEVYKDNYDLDDIRRENELRENCRILVDNLRNSKKDEEKALFHNFIEYMNFFETMGLMVRKRYTPLGNMVQLYKGPIFDTDIVFTRYIEEWQKHIYNPKGMYENMLYLIKKTKRYDWWTRNLLIWR